MNMISTKNQSLHLNPATITTNTGEISTSSMKKDERIPQWSHQETRDFISIRAELERDFTVAKRNKTLWEIVSSKMKEKGYRRSPDQCKCKWKNLVNRYKGKETSDPEIGRQCPFFDELHEVFTDRAKNMHRLLMESESGTVEMKKRGKRRIIGDRSSNEFSDEEDNNNEGEDESQEQEKITRITSNKKRKTLIKDQNIIGTEKSVHEMLREFFGQQQRMEIQWMEMMERRAMERRMFEQEWRQSMEKLERERMIVEQAWREREEHRRMREEVRAEKRDALLTTLLNKLIHEDHL